MQPSAPPNTEFRGGVVEAPRGVPTRKVDVAGSIPFPLDAWFLQSRWVEDSAGARRTSPRPDSCLFGKGVLFGAYWRNDVREKTPSTLSLQVMSMRVPFEEMLPAQLPAEPTPVA